MPEMGHQCLNKKKNLKICPEAPMSCAVDFKNLSFPIKSQGISVPIKLLTGLDLLQPPGGGQSRHTAIKPTPLGLIFLCKHVFS